MCKTSAPWGKYRDVFEWNASHKEYIISEKQRNSTTHPIGNKKKL